MNHCLLLLLLLLLLMLLLMSPKEKKKLENGESLTMTPPKPRKPKSIRRGADTPRSEKRVSGGIGPPPGRIRWGTRGGAENISFGAREQPRAPPTMHVRSPESEKPKEVRCRYDKWWQTKACYHPNRETKYSGKRAREKAKKSRKQNGGKRAREKPRSPESKVV